MPSHEDHLLLFEVIQTIIETDNGVKLAKQLDYSASN